MRFSNSQEQADIVQYISKYKSRKQITDHAELKNGKISEECKELDDEKQKVSSKPNCAR